MKTYNFDYSKYYKFLVPISILLVIGFGFLLFTKGLNYGVDFRGGAEIQLKFKKDFSLQDLRSTLESSQVSVSSVQAIGEGKNEFLLKMQGGSQDLNELAQKVSDVLSAKLGADGVEILKTDIVGPKAGAELRKSSLKAILWALLGIMIYVGLRFDYKYAPGAIIALFHDVVIILGVFVLTQKEFSLQIVAALLAIVGYSVNDTVVIYDRVREIEKTSRLSMTEIINLAINQTMSRTILTSATTFAVCLIMFLMGGGVIHDFFFALSLGVVAGTYSTVFIASPITIFLDRQRQRQVSLKNKIA